MNIEEHHHAKPGKAPESEIDPAKIGKSSIQHPEDDDDGDEVGGRGEVHYAMKCYKCSGVTWITYDTESFKAYSCGKCGAVNVL